jgi:D-alanyl-D-alanine carboxypeptidase
MTMSRQTLLQLPDGYGVDPPLPRFDEATDLEEVEPNIVGRVQSLEPQTAKAWREMKSAAKSENIELLIVSGFRSGSYQQHLIRRKLAAGRTIEEILKVNVAPGYSQHHTGKAVDIATLGTQPLTEEFERTEAFRWLTERATDFGFSMPYGRQNVYGISYEPWHWSRIKLGI